jgi:putative chitinase
MAKVWENFMSIVNKAVEKFQEWKDTIVEYYAKLPNWAKALVPAWLEKQLGLVETKEQKQERETRQAKRKETKTEEKKKEEQEQKAKADAEKKRVEERASKQQKAREETKREIQKEREVKKQPTPAPAAGAPAEAAPSAAPTPAGKPATSAETKPKKLSSETGKKSMISEMDRAKITDPTARAAIMAQVGHESGNFTTLSENLNYKPATLLKIFPKYFKTPEQAQQTAAAGPEAIANKVYGGRMGNALDEGFKYRGRGFIQLTGKDNYKRFGYASNPDDVSNPDAAAETAIKFMMGYKGDWSNITKVTKFVNGGTIGLADREKHFKEYLNDPSITKVGAVASAPSGGGMAAASTSVAADQRAQQKPATPNVINAPTTNNQVVKTTEKTPVVAKDSSRIVTARAA